MKLHEDFPAKENCFYFWKGRIGLYAILKSIGIKPGDEVIMPGYTCVVVPNAVIYLGAKPVYVDINPQTYNIDPEKIESGKGRLWKPYKAKVIIAQHTYGIPADMDKILEIARKYNLYVIEDSCHAIGSKYGGAEVGTVGDASFFSSQWSKPVTTGLGGWVVVNNPDIKGKMDDIYTTFEEPSLRETTLLRLQYFAHYLFFRPFTFWTLQLAYRSLSKIGLLIGSSSEEELDSTMPDGYKKKMSKWQRGLLEKKLQKYDIIHRNAIASLYEQLLKENNIKTLKVKDDYSPVLLFYPVIVKNKKKVLAKARERKIEMGDWFLSPVHPNLYGWEKVGYHKGMCPIAENICDHVVNLPTHTGITEKDAINAVRLIADMEREIA